jgi:hypothetical protein
VCKAVGVVSTSISLACRGRRVPSARVAPRESAGRRSSPGSPAPGRWLRASGVLAGTPPGDHIDLIWSPPPPPRRRARASGAGAARRVNLLIVGHPHPKRRWPLLTLPPAARPPLALTRQSLSPRSLAPLVYKVIGPKTLAGNRPKVAQNRLLRRPGPPSSSSTLYGGGLRPPYEDRDT